MSVYQTPGVYWRIPVKPAAVGGLAVGVPAFLGFSAHAVLAGSLPAGSVPIINKAQPLRHWSEYAPYFGAEAGGSYLSAAVRGFFENGGRFCYVVALAGPPVNADQALEDGLGALDALDDVDLVAVPDLVRLLQPLVATSSPDQVVPPSTADTVRLQQRLIDSCESHGGRFALLDPPSDMDVYGLLSRYRGQLSGTSAALYYPWLLVSDSGQAGLRAVPPCGHIAGVYATTDRRVGVFKAPANIELQGVLDLDRDVSVSDQGQLNTEGVNALRVFPGRGIRVWGARTISLDPQWRYVSVRRLVITAGRWIERNLAPVAFEPHDSRLWTRIVRELTHYFNGLFEAGAIKGATAAQAFFVKCDADTNPWVSREAGRVVTEIGLAAVVPNEFVVIRVSLATSGVTLAAIG
jgi:hypothetical protein